MLMIENNTRIHNNNIFTFILWITDAKFPIEDILSLLIVQCNSQHTHFGRYGY